MSYIVAHCRKVQTTVGLAAVGRHNCREAVYDDKGRALDKLPEYITHPERASLNEGDRCGAMAILKNRSERIREADLARKPQKNAASAIEVNITASADWFEGRKPDEWQKFFKDARKFLAERYGKENLLHWAVHCDEKSPHMHVLLTPIIEGKDGPRYSSANFLGGRKGLRDLQDQIAATVGAKHGLERGVEGSDARHTDQYDWMKDNAKAAKELEKREKAVAAREAKVAEIEKAASLKIPAFTPKLEKKTIASMLMIYTLSNGKEVKGWEVYAAGETALQASAYARRVEDIARGAQAKAEKNEATVREFPKVVQERDNAVMEKNQYLDEFKRLTPEKLRSIADQREAALARAQEQRRDRDNSRGR